MANNSPVTLFESRTGLPRATQVRTGVALGVVSTSLSAGEFSCFGLGISSYGVSYDLASESEVAIGVAMLCPSIELRGLNTAIAIEVASYSLPDSTAETSVATGIFSESYSIMLSEHSVGAGFSVYAEHSLTPTSEPRSGLGLGISAESRPPIMEDSNTAIGFGVQAESQPPLMEESSTAIGLGFFAQSRSLSSDANTVIGLGLDLMSVETGVDTFAAIGVSVAVGDGWTSQYAIGIALESESLLTEVEYFTVGMGIGLFVEQVNVLTINLSLGLGMEAVSEEYEVTDEFLLIAL